MILVEMNEGTKVAVAAEGTELNIADGALKMDLARQQQDSEVVRDVMATGEGLLNVGAGDYYVAEVVIPYREYEEVAVLPIEGATLGKTEQTGGGEEPAIERRALPLDMDKVEVRLFSVDGVTIL